MLQPLILYNNNLSGPAQPLRTDVRKSHVLLINFRNDCDQCWPDYNMCDCYSLLPLFWLVWSMMAECVRKLLTYIGHETMI